MRSHTCTACLWVFLQAVALANPAHATTVIHQDTRGLVRGSSDIVLGRVEGTRAFLDVTRKHIFTEVTVQVTRSLKGTPGVQLTLVQLGGELNGMRTHVAGSPLFSAGEEALLFVWRDSRGRAQVNGLAQGKFEIERDAATGEAVVARRAPGLAIRDARSLRPLRAGETPGKVTLRRILGEIEATLAEAGR